MKVPHMFIFMNFDIPFENKDGVNKYPLSEDRIIYILNKWVFILL